MTRSLSNFVCIVAVLSGAACSPSGNDVSRSATGGGTGGLGGNNAGDVVLGGTGGTSSVGTGAAGTAGGVAPAADPLQAVDDGVTAFQGGDYAGAIMNLMASLAADPNGPAAPAAHFIIARSQQQLSDCTMALAGYRMFLESYPKDDFADDAQYRIGQCYFETGDYVNALVELQKVLSAYAGSDAANDAQYTIGLSYFEQAKVAAPGAAQDALLVQARAAFQAAISDYPERSGGTTSPWAQVSIGRTYELVGDCASELAAMQKAITDFPIDPNDPSASANCTAGTGHLGACDVNNQRAAAIAEANQHITDLNTVPPMSHTCP